MTTLAKQKITPFLWYDGAAEDAAKLYCSLFPDSKILAVMPGPDGKAMVVDFQLAGLRMQAFNGGPAHKFNEAVSLVVHCDSQQEVDHLWSKLTADGGEEVDCGWLKDRFGLRWQIVPTRFFELMADEDPKKRAAVFGAMLKMKKFDIAKLEAAHASASA